MIGLVTLVVLMVLLVVVWRMIGPDQRPGGGPVVRPNPVRRVRRTNPVPPDDNPDFLRDLDRRPRPDDIR
ncbi:hypothetical protein BH20ACT5_BH20ACT5_25820 [soil metagenome]